ncbi:MAG: AAA domain-containing protein [Planctomycetota bacterium]|jgi:very-short-patch-repair endonuclease
MTAKERLIGQLDYVEELARLSEQAVFSVRSYRNMMFFEHQLCGRIGIQHDVADEEGAVWLRIERLQRNPPPPPSEDIRKWLTVSRDPTSIPEVRETIMETMSREEAENLVSEGVVDELDVMDSPPGNADMMDVRLRIDRQPDLQESIAEYVSGPWRNWSEEEKPRRETIAVYDKFFGVVQGIETEGADNPMEVVLGVGMALWETEEKTIEHPLIEALVEIDIDLKTHAIQVRTRETDPQVYLKPFMELDNPAVPDLRRAAQAHFDRMAEQADATDETGIGEFSPFNRRSFEPILRDAVGLLSPEATFYPDVARDPSDRNLPEITEQLSVTDTWAVYVRLRSGNLYVRDIERLKEEVEGSDETALPAPGKRLVTPPEDEPLQSTGPNLQLGIGMEDTGFRDAALEAPSLSDRDVLFPKVYNDAQIEIVRRLESEDGVVVQGPPGTGKTHTIANIICHYLATGRNVLVVSKGEPALEVLRNQIPEEVRNLTISLLTNERQGLKQLEAAVTYMANRVVNKDPTQMYAQKVEREREIIALRKEIDDLDASVRKWATKQLTAVPERLCGGPNHFPADLAEVATDEKRQYEWLVDRLGPGEKHDPKFTEEDVTGIRNARRRLGADLQYRGCDLPSPNDLPDAAAICSVHEDLVRADALSQAAETKSIPLMSTRCSNALARAERMLNEVRSLCKHLNTVAEYPWLRRIYETWLTDGINAEATRPISKLTSEMGRLAALRQAFLERPVQLPMRVRRDALIEAVRRAKLGVRPFSLFSFGNRDTKDHFQRIRIAGQAPTTQTEWGHVSGFLDYQDSLVSVASRWNAISREFELPTASEDPTTADRWLPNTRKALQLARDTVVAYQEQIRDGITTLFPYGIDVEALAREPDVAKWTVKVLETNISRQNLSSARAGIAGAMNRLESCDGPVVEETMTFLRDFVGDPEQRTEDIGDRWRGLLRELNRVLDLRGDIDTVNRVADLAESSGARIWAEKLRTVPSIGATDPRTPENWQKSWRFRRLESYLHGIDGREQLRKLSRQRVESDRRLTRAMAEAVQWRTYLGLYHRMKKGGRLSALMRFVHAIRKIGAGTGIRARRYRGDARKAMLECMDSVPCWIMPTWRVSESLPARLGAFDLVIIDEASQSDAMALPTLLRAKKILVVGDDRQVSPTAAFVEERKLLHLRHSYLRNQPFADMLMPGTSLYDLAQAVFPGSRILLNEHFRCVEPIIRFSLQFYPEEIVPVRIPRPSERLDPPLIDVYVSNGARDGNKVNKAEAVAIVNEIERLTGDPAYEGRTIGVVSLIGNKQAHYIQSLLIERIGEDAFLRHQITCGDAPTFQGKERHVMFVSMVASPGGAHAQIARLFEQRFNVALSRARDRMYLYRSVKPEELSNQRDLKLRAINHFRNPMPVPQADASELIDLCESKFEKDVFRRLTKLGYRVTPQVAVGEFRIDLVIDGEEDRRLAVELDGDRYHGPDRWFDDWNRQKILERVGWRFWRCWASSFALDPDACMDELVATLQEMKIEPVGHEDGQHPYTEYRTVSPDLAATSEARASEETEPETVAELGDKVVVSFDEDARRHFVLTISAEEDDAPNGIVSIGSQAGKALLGASVEDEVQLLWKDETRRATVLQIENAPAGKEADTRQDGAATEDLGTAIAVDTASSGEKTRLKDAVTEGSTESNGSGADATGKATDSVDEQPFWQMTRGDYNKHRWAEGERDRQKINREFKKLIGRAVAEGKPVDPRTLAQYPDLRQERPAN